MAQKVADFKKHIDVLGQLLKDAPGKYDANVEVGYAAPYALYVHEDLTKRHPHGQAKFLEQPAREKAGELGTLVATAVESGKTVEQALELAGGVLLVASQGLVPVETGALRASGYVRVN